MKAVIATLHLLHLLLHPPTVQIIGQLSPHSNFTQLNWRAAEEGWWWSYCKLMLIFTSSSLCRDCDTLIAGNNLLHWVSLCPRHLTLIEKPLLHCNCNYRLLWPVIYRNWRIISLNSIFAHLPISLYNQTLLLENLPLCGVYKKYWTIFMFGIVCNTRTENKLLELP